MCAASKPDPAFQDDLPAVPAAGAQHRKVPDPLPLASAPDKPLRQAGEAVVHVEARVAQEYARAHGLPAVVENVEWVARSYVSSSRKELLKPLPKAVTQNAQGPAENPTISEGVEASDAPGLPTTTSAWGRARPLGAVHPLTLPPDVEEHQLKQLAKARALLRRMKGYFAQDAAASSSTTPMPSSEAAGKDADEAATEATGEERVLRASTWESTPATKLARAHGAMSDALSSSHRRLVANQATSPLARCNRCRDPLCLDVGARHLLPPRRDRRGPPPWTLDHV